MALRPETPLAVRLASRGASVALVERADAMRKLAVPPLLVARVARPDVREAPVAPKMAEPPSAARPAPSEPSEPWVQPSLT